MFIYKLKLLYWDLDVIIIKYLYEIIFFIFIINFKS